MFEMTYHQVQLIPGRYPCVSCDCGVLGTFWLAPVGTGSITFRGQWSPVMRAGLLLTITTQTVSMGKYMLSS